MSSAKVHRLLIANRGEIAIRVARTARRMGFTVVGIYSALDKNSQHLDHCDEVHSLGDGSIADTYLNIQKITDLIKSEHITHVHPGYGFLSERATFVRAVEKAGAVFVGPSAEIMESMGDKISSKNYMKKLGVPLVPGSDGPVTSAEQAQKVADVVGYPVLLKASAGGGGKGMRIVNASAELHKAFEGAVREAKAYFGDGTVFVEKYLASPHHVEVQVIGDGHGGGGHVFDRECSLQRRHQKLLEESPAPLLLRHEASRKRVLELSNKIVTSMKYAGAGTLEFVADDDGNVYFLEMNTRLQVEHPVTEWVTGLDLVELQLEVALGKKLPAAPLAKETRGHAIEVRIYAETPFEHLPTGGRVIDVQLPQGPYVRIDSSIYAGYDVPTDYDPTLLKLSVWGGTRTQAIERLSVALSELRILGVQSNQGLFVEICKEEQFKSGHYGTPYLDQKRGALLASYERNVQDMMQALGPALVLASQQSSATQAVKGNGRDVSMWNRASARYNVEGVL